jgi:hypothetical protein
MRLHRALTVMVTLLCGSAASLSTVGVTPHPAGPSHEVTLSAGVSASTADSDLAAVGQFDDWPNGLTAVADAAAGPCADSVVGSANVPGPDCTPGSAGYGPYEDSAIVRDNAINEVQEVRSSAPGTTKKCNIAVLMDGDLATASYSEQLRWLREAAAVDPSCALALRIGAAPLESATPADNRTSQ